jgi:hypothetical protein
VNVRVAEEIHVARNGATYDRSEQYTNDGVSQKRGYNEWYWRGTRLRNFNQTMTGRVYRTSQGEWFHEETRYDHGRVGFHMNSTCHDSGIEAVE